MNNKQLNTEVSTIILMEKFVFVFNKKNSHFLIFFSLTFSFIHSQKIIQSWNFFYLSHHNTIKVSVFIILFIFLDQKLFSFDASLNKIVIGYQMFQKNEWKVNHSINFLDLKYFLRQSTCHVAKPNKQHIEKMEKYNTLELVDSFVSRI